MEVETTYGEYTNVIECAHILVYRVQLSTKGRECFSVRGVGVRSARNIRTRRVYSRVYHESGGVQDAEWPVLRLRLLEDFALMVHQQ
jgi:hypothetical protein